MEAAWNIFGKSTESSAAAGGGGGEIPTISIKLESTHRKQSEPYCNECGSHDLVAYEGHQICSSCGTDLGPILEGDDGSLYHDSSKSGNTHRLSGGMNSLLQKSSLGTSIGPGSYKFRSLMRYHNYNSMPYKERSQWRIFKQIKSACEKVNLPHSISQEAQRMYKNIAETCNARGNHRKGLIASCVFYACKYEGVPRTGKEIAQLFNIELQDLTKAMKKFRSIHKSKKNHTQISTALDYIPRFCQQLDFSTREKEIVECMVAKSYIIQILPECTSISLAATILYEACNMFDKPNKIKDRISGICRVSDVTILKCYRKIQQKIIDIIPNEFKKTSKIGST